MKVSISQVRPNPFQVRKHVDRERVQALADEIKLVGHWGSLRARKQGSHYELCFGHRRLDALKLLKVKEVDLEVVDLSDDEMATQGLIENLQREGLTDIEKAEGIKHLMERFGQTRQQVAGMMGLSESRISQLLGLTGLTQQSKKHIASGKIAGSTAHLAMQLGGEEMLATAVKHAIPRNTLQAIQQELTAISEPKIREKITKAVIAGRVREPGKVREQERKIRAVQTGPAPTDLRLIIRKWTGTIHEWNKRLDEVLPFMDYVEGDPKTATEFKAVVRELIDKLKRFL